MEKKPLQRQKIFLILITSIALLGIGTSSFFYMQYQNLLKNPTIQEQLEAKDLVKKISRFMLLPTNEVPTVATVSDYKKLQNQPFFKNAKNGNKVLIYTKAATAILYDPKVDKIIAVAPLNLGQTATPIRIALYNGTETAGLANTVEDQLKGKVNNIVISVKGNAKNTYKKTVVVDLSGKQSKAASELAAVLGGEMGRLPAGEKAPPNTDLLIILGK